MVWDTPLMGSKNVALARAADLGLQTEAANLTRLAGQADNLETRLAEARDARDTLIYQLYEAGMTANEIGDLLPGGSNKQTMHGRIRRIRKATAAS